MSLVGTILALHPESRSRQADGSSGFPPVWRPQKLPFSVTKNPETFSSDQNTTRCAAYPAEALFRSLSVMQPHFNMRGVELVTDRSTLRKLLRFASEDIDRSFRIDIKIQGSVMFLCRSEGALRKIISGSDSSRFGHSFEKASFDENSSGHHRVVRYKLGGIHCLVRFEADAYSSDLAEPSSEITAEEVGADNLLGALNSLSITPPQGVTTGSVQVLNKGRVVMPSSIIEIKTKSVSRQRLRLKGVIPQLWFAQTPKLRVGYHTDGEFQEILELSMEEKFERWEKENQSHLRRLVRLLQKLKDVVRNAPSQQCVAVCEANERPLCLRINGSNGMRAALPEEIVKQYEWDAV